MQKQRRNDGVGRERKGWKRRRKREGKEREDAGATEIRRVAMETGGEGEVALGTSPQVFYFYYILLRRINIITR